MDDLAAQKTAIYTEYNRSMEKFKAHNFATNRFYIVILMIVLAVILICKQVFLTGSIVITFVFSFFGLCVAIMWVITQDSYQKLISIKIANVLEEIEKELPVKPYTMEHEEIKKYKAGKKFFSYDSMQNFMGLVLALVFTVLFFSELAPFFIMVKTLLN